MHQNVGTHVHVKQSRDSYINGIGHGTPRTVDTDESSRENRSSTKGSNKTSIMFIFNPKHSLLQTMIYNKFCEIKNQKKGHIWEHA